MSEAIRFGVICSRGCLLLTCKSLKNSPLRHSQQHTDTLHQHKCRGESRSWDTSWRQNSQLCHIPRHKHTFLSRRYRVQNNRLCRRWTQGWQSCHRNPHSIQTHTDISRCDTLPEKSVMIQSINQLGGGRDVTRRGREGGTHVIKARVWARKRMSTVHTTKHFSTLATAIIADTMTRTVIETRGDGRGGLTGTTHIARITDTRAKLTHTMGGTISGTANGVDIQST